MNGILQRFALGFFLFDRVSSLNNWKFLFQSNKKSSRPSSNADIIISEIVNLLPSTNRGLNNVNKEQIVSSIQQLLKLPSTERNKGNVDGKWKLLWTTEKETLFFAKNGLFGSPCTDILQSIDRNTEFLSNQILFENGREFTVLGSISSNQGDNDNERINFKFKQAILKISPINLKLPPFGQGWFESIYIDGKYRISYDIRDDYLISERI